MDLTQVYIKIQELLINDEKVKLPGIGEFEVVVQSATFLQDGKTIVPPSKKLLFVQSDSNCECEQWMKELGEKISESLKAEGEFEVPGFGVFADKGEGVIGFTLNEEFDFAPDNFSLEAISLEEVHREEPAAVEEKLDEPAVEEKQDEPVIEEKVEVVKKEVTDELSDVEHKKECKRKWMMGIVLALVFVAAIVLFAVLFKEDLMQLLQNILYTDEELEIMKKWAAQ